jgi:hypothetical protein
MPRALAPRGTNGNGEFIPMTAHVDVKCMLRRYLHLSVTDPQRPPGAQPEADLQLLLKQLKLELPEQPPPIIFRDERGKALREPWF